MDGRRGNLCLEGTITKEWSNIDTNNLYAMLEQPEFNTSIIYTITAYDDDKQALSI